MNINDLNFIEVRKGITPFMWGSAKGVKVMSTS
jgi:hypothetical protein